MDREKFVLANGLQVYTTYIPNKKTITCGVRVKQGAKDETKEINGLSHLTEHLAFKIKNKESKKSVHENIQNLEQNGVFYNATTYKESTFFYFEGLSSETELILEYLSYLVVNKDKVEKEDLEKEKLVVLKEAGQYFGSTGQVADRIGQAVWGEAGYGQMVIGTLENIKSFTPEMVDRLIEEAYTPDNCFLTIVGDFDFEKMKVVIEKYFGHWRGIKKKKDTAIAKEHSRVIIHDEYGGKRTCVGLGFQSYSIQNEKYRYVEMLRNYFLLPDSMLMKELRENRGLLYNISCHTNVFRSAGYIGFSFSADNEEVMEILQIMLKEFREFAARGIDEPLLTSLKKRREMEVLFAMERTQEQMKMISQCVLYDLDWSIEKEVEEIMKINLTEMNQVIREVFDVNRMGISILGKQERVKVESLIYN